MTEASFSWPYQLSSLSQRSLIAASWNFHSRVIQGFSAPKFPLPFSSTPAKSTLRIIRGNKTWSSSSLHSRQANCLKHCSYGPTNQLMKTSKLSMMTAKKVLSMDPGMTPHRTSRTAIGRPKSVTTSSALWITSVLRTSETRSDTLCFWLLSSATVSVCFTIPSRFHSRKISEA